MDFKVVPLHEHKNLTDTCSEILNEEWPRSMAARNHSLSKSCDALPVCLAFVQCGSNVDMDVLGFSKISAVQGIQQAGLVESVVIRKKCRGQGFGRTLMDLTEQYAKGLGIQTLYLSTLDKEGFYAHLGYLRCQPVVSLGANAHRVPEAMLSQFLASPQLKQESSQVNSQGGCDGTDIDAKLDKTSIESSSESQSRVNAHNSETISQTQPTPPPPPPPPPPLIPPPAPSQSTKTTHDRMVKKMDPNSMTWMSKVLLCNK